MGLSINGAEFLAQAKKAGARFDSVLTLGRQHVSVSPRRLQTILQEAACWPPPQGAAEFFRGLNDTVGRFDVFARALGPRTVVACDASAYEGATWVHDLNQPIPEGWAERYDVVIDGGTLEHVFNFPVAVANCMRLVKTGVHLVHLTPANNQCGHGFYQFSPELFYRVLTPENGFRILRMVALLDSDGQSSWLGLRHTFPIRSRWYEVADPAEIKDRVTLISRDAAMLFVLARKESPVRRFQRFPQQSDYVEQWQTGASANPLGQSNWGLRVIAHLTRWLPETMWRERIPRWLGLVDPFRRCRFRRKHSFANRKYCRPVHD